MSENKIEDEVWQTVKELNHTWAVDGDVSALNNYFHENIVVIHPGDKYRLEGREECINSWREFIEEARVIYFKELEPDIKIYGDGKFAVVTYYYDMEMEIKGETVHSDGRDMFVLVKEDGKWWVVADQFSSFPGG